MNVTMTRWDEPVCIYKTMNESAAMHIYDTNSKIKITFQINGSDILTIPHEKICEKPSKWTWSCPTYEYLSPEQLDVVKAILWVNGKKYDFEVNRRSGLEMVDGTFVGGCEACLNLNEKGEWKPLLDIGLNHKFH